MDAEFKAHISQFLSSAELVFSTGDYTSATILYFKTVFVALDLLIFQKLQKTPKDHAERFRILEHSFSQHYALLDSHYSIYRSTYSVSVDKATCEEVRAYVLSVTKEVGL